MHLRINNTDFEEISNLSFSPEADLINNSLPIPEFECRVYTNVNIQYGQWADLLDENNNLYAHYWIRFAERIGRDEDNDTYVVRLIAQSPLAFLERVTMPAEMVDDDARVLIMDILDYLGAMGHDGDIISSNDIDDAVGDVHITGFCPEQSARERLQWILTAAGGYALSAFNDVIAVNKIPLGKTSSATLIPLDKTFWKPSISYRDYVSKIKVTGYSYTKRTPTNVDEYVTDGTDYWIQQKQVISLTNPDLPSGAPNNEVVVDGLTVLTPARASIVASVLANYYFNRAEIDADVINNAEYEPGMEVMVYTDTDTIYRGYISECNFTFTSGLNNKSKIHLVNTSEIEVAILTVNYTWDGTRIKRVKYYLPLDVQYSITAEYVEYEKDGHRYIFRPTVSTITGTLTSDHTENVPVDIALDYYQAVLSDSETLLEQEQTMLNWIDGQYNTKKAEVISAEMSKSAKNKLLKDLSNERNSMEKRTRNYFESMITQEPQGIVHIVSVDDVELEEQTVEDPDDRTIVIS